MADFRKIIREECLEKEDAFCTSECPFKLDVREFTARLSRGGFNSAYRLYSNRVGFPVIVSTLCAEPCALVCPRARLDAPISIRMLEAASVRYAVNTKPNSYNLPPKGHSAAIVGGGPGGLACALRLTNRKYDVTVYDRASEPGGSLWKRMDAKAAARELELQFMYERYAFVPGSDISDIEALLSSNDAVYISTGAGGYDFGLMGNGPFPMASAVPGVFLGGELAGASAVGSIAHGLEAAALIESYLKTGVMKGASGDSPTKMALDPDALKYSPPILPADGISYTKEEAVSEASRCIRCRCDACVRHCWLMAYYGKSPKRLEAEIEATINPGTLDGDGTIVTRFISTCNQCGLCKEICPKGIDLGEMLRASHEALNKKGAMPWAFHEFWLRDMDFADGGGASLSALPGGRERAKYLYFPGCQLGASNPEYVISTYRRLREKHPDTAISLMCCGAPAVWAGAGEKHSLCVEAIKGVLGRFGVPKVVLACPACAGMFARYLPGIETVMLYDVMAEWGMPNVREDARTVSVFDPCSARQMPETRGNVRRILIDAGYKLEPLPYEGERAQCCSWGGQILAAAPNYAKSLVKKRAAEGSCPYVVYCSNCRDIFAVSGKPVKHLLDIILGIGGWTTPPPSLSERRKNRIYLKRALLKEYWPELSPGEDDNVSRLMISTELRETLDRCRILEEDIAAAIESCEKNGRVIIDTETSHRFAHEVIGQLTHWAEYKLTDEGKYELMSAYCHRMSIEREEAPSG
ncbi:MAG: NAD(P)-binding protein [Synergistaceae bacterium]|jgi:Fe-S oxidoreductase|nr:NAD(P)-binding protein [Synergistaceae bacterium]